MDYLMNNTLNEVVQNIEKFNTIATQNAYLENLVETAKHAFKQQDEDACYQIHSTLYQLYNLQICDPASAEAKVQHHPFLYQIRKTIEDLWLTELQYNYITQTKNADQHASISARITQLCDDANLSEHPLFDFLANDATERQLHAFFMSDYELNIRFFDLLILALLNSPATARNEMIKNLWDESGRGDRKETHVKMFDDLMEHHRISGKDQIQPHDSWQKFAGYNLFMLASLNRQFYYYLMGIMAATEIIDPKSYLKVQASCERFGLDHWLYRYYSEHSEVDIEHAKGWLDYVIEPLAKEKDIKDDILMGAHYRLETCKNYYDSLYAYLKNI